MIGPVGVAYRKNMWLLGWILMVIGFILYGDLHGLVVLRIIDARWP